MSRIGRMPVTIPAGVEVSVADGNVVTVKGPKGTLTQTMRPEMSIEIENNEIKVGRPSDDKLHRSLHGLTRSLVHDMILAVEPMVTEGTYEVRVLKDHWTTVTADGKLAAHYENSILITDGEPEILTVAEGL